MSEVFRVVKPGPGQEIRAYKKFSGEIGAEMIRDEYIKALVEEIGNPFFVMTKNQLLEKLNIAARSVQERMQSATVSVAGLQVPKY